LGRKWCVGTEFEEVDEVYRGRWDGVRRELNMARKWGVGVLVDFHAVCGVRMGMRILGLFLVKLGCAEQGEFGDDEEGFGVDRWGFERRGEFDWCLGC
jgi:hypothetical protein